MLCRPPPYTKKQCPKGHGFVVYYNPGESWICDLCGLKALMFGQVCYNDVKCNSGMCQSCYNLLPEEIGLKYTEN